MKYSEESQRWLDGAKRQVKPYGMAQIDRFRMLLTAVSDQSAPLEVADTVSAEGHLRIRLVCGARRPQRPVVAVVAELLKTPATWASGGTRITAKLTALPCVSPDRPHLEDEVMLAFAAHDDGLITARSVPEGVAPDKAARSTFFAAPKRVTTPKPPAMPPDAFVSYVQEDLPLIERLLERFRTRDIRYWVDFEQLVPGASVISSIQLGLTSSRYCIVCLSARQLKSGFCKHEYEAALIRAIEEDSRRVIPLHLEEVPSADIPPLLRPLLSIKFWDETSLETLLTLLTQRN